MARGLGATGGRERAAERTILAHAIDGALERVRGLRVEQQRGLAVARDRGHAADRRCDRRQAVRHRLEQCGRCALAATGGESARWQHERVGGVQERALALRLLSFGAMVTQLGDTAEPHRLCAYLFEVASLFTTFYEECPVLKAESEALRATRLALCALTLDVLTKGLTLLSVPVPERM